MIGARRENFDKGIKIQESFCCLNMVKFNLNIAVVFLQGRKSQMF